MNLRLRDFLSWEGNIAKKCYRHGRSYLSLSRADYILAVFPKTGSTWIRFFLYNLMSQIEGREIAGTIDEMDFYMPEIGNANFVNPWPFRSCRRIVKTHHPSNFITRRNRAILILRDPKDIAVSYFHNVNARYGAMRQVTLKDVIHDRSFGFEGFIRHYNSWSGCAILTLRYEDLKKDAFTGFRRLVDVLGITASDKDVLTAMENSDLSAMRKAQDSSLSLKRKLRKGFQFARKGTVGDWKTLFDEDDLSYWRQVRDKYQFDQYE